MATHRHLSGVLAIVLGLVVGASAVIVARNWGSSGSAERHDQVFAGILDPNEPLGPNGAPTTLSDAVANAPVPVYRPQTDFASDQTIAGIWVRTIDTPEVFIRYDSGIEVSVRPADFTNGFDNFYNQQIKEGQPGALTTIDGISVYVNPGGVEGTNAPWADMVLNKILVEVVAPANLTQDDVVSLVDSIIKQSTLLP